MSTLKKIEEVVAKGLGIGLEEVVYDLKYQEIPEWDSMSHLILITEIENVYEVSIDMEDILEMGSLMKIRDVLKKYEVELV
jgi:acyl carrier protein